MFPLRRLVTICTCRHKKSEHWCTKQNPAGPCTLCGCTAFTPERICRCGHGEKAHLPKGSCHEGDGCRVFRPA
jgi:hypothetical protein